MHQHSSFRPMPATWAGGSPPSTCGGSIWVPSNRWTPFTSSTKRPIVSSIESTSRMRVRRSRSSSARPNLRRGSMTVTSRPRTLARPAMPDGARGTSVIGRSFRISEMAPIGRAYGSPPSRKSKKSRALTGTRAPAPSLCRREPRVNDPSVFSSAGATDRDMLRSRGRAISRLTLAPVLRLRAHDDSPRA